MIRDEMSLYKIHYGIVRQVAMKLSQKPMIYDVLRGEKQLFFFYHTFVYVLPSNHILVLCGVGVIIRNRKPPNPRYQNPINKVVWTKISLPYKFITKIRVQ